MIQSRTLLWTLKEPLKNPFTLFNKNEKAKSSTSSSSGTPLEEPVKVLWWNLQRRISGDQVYYRVQVPITRLMFRLWSDLLDWVGSCRSPGRDLVISIPENDRDRVYICSCWIVQNTRCARRCISDQVMWKCEYIGLIKRPKHFQIRSILMPIRSMTSKSKMQ